MRSRTVRNPIIPGFNPDPSICRVGSNYYIATSTFEYFPGVPIYHSVDLVDWKLIGHALSRPSQLNMRHTEPGAGIYAPTLRHHDGRFYVAAALVNDRGAGYYAEPRGFYVWTDDIKSGTWSDPIYFDVWGIDQDLFFDDGKVYLYTAREPRTNKPYNRCLGRYPPNKYISIYGVEIDLASGRSLHQPRLLMECQVDGGVCEGSHVYKKDGWYYLMTAQGGTGTYHQEWIARSRSPLGPFDPAAVPSHVNPLVYNPEGKHEVQCTGHADLVEGHDGRWWMVLLATRVEANGAATLGRETWLAPVEWHDGWPVVNDRQPIDEIVRGLTGESPSASWVHNFDTKLAGPVTTSVLPGWYFLRTPWLQDYDLSTGRLGLRANATTFRDHESPTMLLRKQTSPIGDFEARLEAWTPASQHEAAGAVIYWSMYAFGAINVSASESGRVVYATWIAADDTEQSSTRIALPDGPVGLVIRARPSQYQLLVKQGDWSAEVARVDSTLIDRRAAHDSAFTGAHWGLFSHSTDGLGCSSEAYFSSARFTDLA